jgi:adenine phosphoribosyltransferase
MILQFKSAIERIKNHIRDVPDFPQPGIVFKDITPILADPQLFRLAINIFSDRYQRRTIEKIVAIDARGFLFGGALAHVLGIGLVPIRKKGKLPYRTLSQSYTLEYGSNTVEMHADAIKPGERVVIIDDLLATGGTAQAACHLVRQAGGEIIEVAFLIELLFLKGRQQFGNTPIFSAIQFD